MYRIWIFSCLLWPWPLIAEPPPELLRAEIQELQMVIRNLREDNRRLETRNRRLMEDVLHLGGQIRTFQQQLNQAQSASTHSAPAASEEPAEADATPENRMALLYVNPHWHYVILNQGSDQGIENGDYGSVYRAGKRIAVIKVTDTKPGQSIAELDLSSLEGEGVYPTTGDTVEFR